LWQKGKFDYLQPLTQLQSIASHTRLIFDTLTRLWKGPTFKTPRRSPYWEKVTSAPDELLETVFPELSLWLSRCEDQDYQEPARTIALRQILRILSF
jgi:hypothetical protein